MKSFLGRICCLLGLRDDRFRRNCHPGGAGRAECALWLCSRCWRQRWHWYLWLRCRGSAVRDGEAFVRAGVHQHYVRLRACGSASAL